jgi:DNA polymerase-3 subunit delta'
MTKETDWGIVGHTWAVHLLQRALEQGELSHAYLFTGPPNVGKETMAMALAKAVLCREEDAPCGECRACRVVAGGNHPDLHHCVPETASGRMSIDQVRELGRQLSLTPSMGSHRVAILSDFDQATPSAANALLKTLEEPPAYVLLVLLAPDTDSLLPTIVSRCQVVPFHPLPAEVIREALVGRWGIDPQQAQALSNLCGGRLGWAVRAATDPAPLAFRDRRLDELFQLMETPLVQRFRYVADMAHDPEVALQTLDVWTGWWRDVMVVAAGAEAPVSNADRWDQLARHADALGIERVAGLVKATRETAGYIRSNANLRLALEVLVAFDLPRM